MKYEHDNGTEIREVFFCNCGSADHQMIFDYWMEDNEPDKELYLQVHLSDCRDSFFHRLWTGIQYIRGKKSRFGQFDEVVIRKDDINRLFNLISMVKKDMGKAEIEK